VAVVSPAEVCAGIRVAARDVRVSLYAVAGPASRGVSGVFKVVGSRPGIAAPELLPIHAGSLVVGLSSRPS